MSTANFVDDALLWHRFQRGDTTALGQLMSAHYSALLHYGSRFTRNTDNIRDCIQDTFVELWNRRDTLRSLTGGQVKPYLMTVLRRLLHQTYLHESRFTLLLSTDEAATESFSPEDRLIEQETGQLSNARIRQLLDELPRRSREAIYLRFFDNLDRAAIAQIMGISEQSVSNLFQEAFRFIRRQATSDQFWLFWLLLLCY
ncbi:sigma-70 family RNA polymerase sigma factor [Rudanella paleaurantiibacter]|uniref:Sigma-70 family RNA polymerase sigma factor n=1 Tax=Rudanella paleaurantiibacter TaxID=2614655 RepID=A0A7J5U2R9_9BACT|nr:sigma-70 family RNA polymerase sigma factor [Rudanella paleaurantiibacter]KAB7731792.1 sigma-70 family RNA polymerase sigma factor [Rudanella paleaurantiibacter]